MTEQQPYEVVREHPGFVMPADFDLDSAPDPTDPNVRLRAVPAQTAAALRFSGRWTRDRYDEHARRLLDALDAAGLEVAGLPRFARFDPPWTPWFLGATRSSYLWRIQLIDVSSMRVRVVRTAG